MTDPLDEVLAAITPTDPAADVGTIVPDHRRRAEEWRTFVAAVKPRLDASTAEGRRLRRALDQAVDDADRLVRAHRAVETDMVKIRAATLAAKGRRDV